jgi:1-deoxy-D-xylulose-5-phosphate reductoisomerase
MSKRVAILGSTGSIGTAALEVIRTIPDEATVVGLSANGDWRKLAAQAREHGVRHVAIADERYASDLRQAVGAGVRVYAGASGLLDLLGGCEPSFVLSAIVGSAGLPPTLAAVEAGIDVGLANKESLVVAGSLLLRTARRRDVQLLPVDSEHSAIFQCLPSGKADEVRRILLTASGGPFREWSGERIAGATLEEALKHPTWSMGPKITIDSATMMNKALEIVEARWLFDIPAERIGVVVHPESIVHSMVEFCDGSVIAQLGTPNMRTPIQYALTYPRRLAAGADFLRWDEARSLRFEPPDMQRFPALRLGFEAARRGGTAGAVLNASNEAAVELFRGGKIAFGRIAELAERALTRHTEIKEPSLGELLDADAWARREVSTQCPG